MKIITQRTTPILIAIFTGLAGMQARADGGWYVGASAGQAYLEVDVEGADENVFGFDEGGTDIGYGLGAKFMLWSLEFRAEYEIYDIEDTENVEMLSVGVSWVF